MTARQPHPEQQAYLRLVQAAEQAANDDEARAIADQIRAFARRVRAARWEPYVWQRPHVHPPGWVSERDPRLAVCDDRCADLPAAVPGVHEWWVQRGGRGTGKTEAASRYYNDHMSGPPCDPRVPGGHRGTIVAPTQPDAVSSCVTGVSGLQAVNPGVEVAVSKEGTLVRWPNGAVARVLGANSARDVQRARAWTNVCVAEGALIRTATGLVPIENVRPGDLVHTRTGLRPVVRAECTGLRPVIPLTASSGERVWATPDHPVARPDGGFTRADAGGSVLVWLDEPSGTPGTPMASASPAATGTASPASSTVSSTSARSAPCPTGGTSTTSTTTRATTTRATSRRSRRPITQPSTPTTAPPSGTRLEAALRSLVARLAPQHAASVARYSPTATPPTPSTAGHAARNEAHRHEHTSRGCARCAEQGSPAPAGTPHAPAPRRAVAGLPTRRAKVYDLAVDGHHEFYADGILVGNCLWWLEEFAAMPLAGGLAGVPGHETDPPGMLDQAPFTLRLGPRPHGVLTTTPTGRDEVTAILGGPVETWGRTQDAHRLPLVVRESLERKYPPGTTLGRQELGGEQVGDVPGALWIQARTTETPPEDDRPGINNDRLLQGAIGWRPHLDVNTLVAQSPDGQRLLDHLRRELPAAPEAPAMVERAAIGVDPAGGSTENGIAAVGTVGDHGYTLADLSLHGGPATWGMLAVLAHLHFGGEGIALERTYGGDQTEHAVKTAANELGVPMPALLRAATVEGKKARAIPVQALGQVRRLHMVGVFPRLEGEMTSWVEDQTPESPNRLDAWVHAHRHLMIRAGAAKVARPRGRQMTSSWRG